MSTISAGVNVNLNRPTAGLVSSQLHTPLSAKSQTDSSVPMSAVKRETNIVDPLSNMNETPQRIEIDSPKSNDEKQLVESYSSRSKTYGELFLMKISVPPIEITSVPSSIGGLQTLARVNAWKHVIKMSDQILATSSIEGIQFNLVFRLRMTAFFRLKMFDEIFQEATAALTFEEQCLGTGQSVYEHGVQDKILALQLLLIEARAMTGRGEEALQQLYSLRKWLCNNLPFHDVQLSDEILWWKWRVQWSIINTLSKQRQWRQSIYELQSILRDVQWKRSHFILSAQSIHSHASLLSSEILIHCRMSRILLQIGAIDSASRCINRATTLLSKLPISHSPFIQDRCLLAQGLVLFSKDKIEEARDIFQKIMANEISRKATEIVESPVELLFPVLSDESQSIPSNKEFSLFRHPLAGAIEIEESTLASATNNYAICSLYLRQIHEAVRKIEELILDDPTQHLIDPVVFNLCTMYDLSCAPELSIEKKKALQEVANHYYIEDLHWKSFRLN